MLKVWDAPMSRPTRDAEFLGQMDNDLEEVKRVVGEICLLSVDPPDGLEFNTVGILAERITEGADYKGVRVKFFGLLGKTKIPMQLDIGFGDVVTPKPELHQYPTLLDQESPALKMYPVETVVAEKFEAMVKLGELNSRMKDFYDIWMLSRSFPFSDAMLMEAIAKTFEARGTELDPNPLALTKEFSKLPAKQQQWQAFLRRLGEDYRDLTFQAVTGEISDFLRPLIQQLVDQKPFASHWQFGRGWTDG